MKHCPICEKSFGDDVNTCDIDGSMLQNFGFPKENLVGNEIKGRYKVIEKLGEGGMAVVYRADQINIGRTVALKVLNKQYSEDPEFVKRFRQEARIAASLNHPNVIQVYDFDQAEDGTLFIAMEYAAGRSLRAVMHDGPLGIDRTLSLGIQMAEGLGTAHRAGVIHRDIKPENLMVVGDNEQVKVMDFGIARLRESGPGSRLTKTGIIMGTPMYMAPEQIEGREVTEKTDMYAFGIVLYEMLSGVTPFKAPTPATVLMKQLKEIPAPIRKLRRDVPTSIQRLISHTLEKKPERRPKDMATIVEALRKERSRLARQLMPQETTSSQSTNLIKTEVINSASADVKPLATATSWLGRIFQSAPGSANAHDSKNESLNATMVDREPVEGESQTIAETMVSTPPPEIAHSRQPRLKRAGLVAAVGLILVISGVVGYQLTRETSIQLKGATVNPSTPTLNENIPTSLQIQPEKTEISVKHRVRVRFAIGSEQGQPTEVDEGVKWWTTDPSVLELRESGEIEGIAPGTAVLMARYRNLDAQPVTIVVRDEIDAAPPPRLEMISIKIHAEKTTIKKQERLVLQAKARFSDGSEGSLENVRWQTSDARIAAINSAGEVVGKNPGKAKITAVYNEATSEPIVMIVKASPTKKSSPIVKRARGLPEKDRRGTQKPSATTKNQVSVSEFVNTARAERDRGNYARALLELEKARKVDPTSQAVLAEITATKRACNAERVLGRPDLRC